MNCSLHRCGRIRRDVTLPETRPHIVRKISSERNCRMRLFRFDELRKLMVLAWATLVFASLANAQPNGAEHEKAAATPPGLFITPTALDHSVQQVLNPGLTNYPNFVAGEAVKAVVSPDGKTLAILTAGMNSLYFPNVGEPSTNPNIGQVDQSASTQFLFLYDIAGTNRKKGTTPVLKQVIQQLNAHVGLVWAPNSQTIYAAGGCDDVVY